MADIDYPKQLPTPLQEGYALDTQDPVTRTQMVTGRVRSRIKNRYVPLYVDATFIFNGQQKAFFEAWYSRTLNEGIEWFNCPLKIDGTVEMYEVQFARIYQGPTLVQLSFWRYTFRLMLRRKPLIPEGWEQFPDLWFGMNLIDLAVNREWPKA
jgi:hypothetical protein